ncbi:MAG: hypothetical protein ABW032_09420 [Burkholderiaceae bacterium]
MRSPKPAARAAGFVAAERGQPRPTVSATADSHQNKIQFGETAIKPSKIKGKLQSSRQPDHDIVHWFCAATTLATDQEDVVPGRAVWRISSEFC